MFPVSRSSGSADGDGFGNPDHAVERCDGNGRFALLAGQRAAAEFRADQRFCQRSRQPAGDRRPSWLRSGSLRGVKRDALPGMPIDSRQGTA